MLLDQVTYVTDTDAKFDEMNCHVSRNRDVWRMSLGCQLECN